MQIKLQSVKLAMKYLRRVSSELEAIQGGPDEEDLMLQGVRFAFRVHQVTTPLAHVLIMLRSSNMFAVLNPTVLCSLQVALMVTQCEPFKISRRRLQPSSLNGKFKINMCISKDSLAEVEIMYL